jgi:hypothetical protein
MSQSVEGVEGERCSQNGFSSVFQGLRKTMYEFDNVGGSKCLGSYEICQSVSVKH